VSEVATRARELGLALRADAIEWCRDRSWEVRVPVLLFMVYLLVQHLRELEYMNFFMGGIVLGTHEFGHVAFSLLKSEWLTYAMGTGFQWLAPLIAAGVMWKAQRDYFGMAFCLGWFGVSAFHSACYISDARGQLGLILVSPWGGARLSTEGDRGDWEYLLDSVGLLQQDTKIAFVFQVIGVVSILAGLALGLWLCWTMQRLRDEPPPKPPEWASRGAGGSPFGTRPPLP
jgi:hypothetical protein